MGERVTISNVMMDIRRALFALAVVAVVSVAPAHAGPFEDAVAATNQGDYARALDILRPGALHGHPDQPQMWDADSRAGFVIVADKLSDQLWNDGASDEVLKSHEADFVLAFEIASAHATSDVFVNWGMRYYLGKMYLFGTGVAEDGDHGEALLRQVAESDDEQYKSRARDVLCVDQGLDEFC